VRANQNVLRVTSTAYDRRWNMCLNLQWLTCALRGRLPGQGNATLRFANEVADLDTKWFDRLGVSVESTRGILEMSSQR